MARSVGPSWALTRRTTIGKTYKESTIQQKSAADFVIALAAISAIGGVARSFFNVGRPIVQNVVEKAVNTATDTIKAHTD